ncbi:AAA family ATPase [Acinetobacter shaoyimingii]|uniref:AAA family ATPase n=1 Tax=Acinetobacter shaoyimingii TaxID=2715164 RepID=A0A6G8RS92_9GAMM|nr:AAA family ATPase [Acinetobacter shaoyimingii]QIO04755.1 AAA family ATPase [Acinetobacter shaoyimingii]
MKIHSLRLRHCYHFADLKIDFKYHDKPITVILGDQASGKTAIIKNIYQSLTWFSSRLKDMRTAGVVMLDSDIMRDKVQSKIEIQVEFNAEIGQLKESTSTQETDLSLASWQLYKTLNTSGIGHSKVDADQLEQLVHLYLKAIQQDPLQGLPMIAYFPSDRFVSEINLLSKNNPSVFLNHSAYELVAIPYTTFARFFEWFREISDIENAQTAQLFQQILKDHNLKNEAEDGEKNDLQQTFSNHQPQLHSPCILALKKSLNIIFPEITDLYLDYLPKLQLMVTYKDQAVPFQQLSSSMRNWIALVGDVVRRLCLLNPNSLYPSLEGEGVLLIDNIDTQLDQTMRQNILERLHQAFPQLQIIVTGQSEDLLEFADTYQYLKLDHKMIHDVSLAEHRTNLNDIYQDLLHEISPSIDALIEPQAVPDAVQSTYEQFQYLSPEQQHEFIQLIVGDDNISTKMI